MMESWYYWMWYLIAVLVAISVAVVGRRQIRENANVAKARGKKANKVASKRLKNAAKLLQKHDADNFYDEVMRALLGYTADKLNIPLSTLNKDNIQSELQKRNVSQELIALFIKCLNDCEFARYAPGDPNETMENVYDGAVNAITNMESSIRKNQKQSSESKIKTFVLLLMLMPSVSIMAQTKVEADTLYAQEEYEKASQVYLTLLNEHNDSPVLLYNLGNCYFKMDSLARSILCFERARLLSPGDDAIKQNLEFVRSRLIDKVAPQSELFFVTWWRSLSNLMSIDSWLSISLILFIVVLGSLLAYAFLTERWIRKTAVCVCAVSLFGTIIINLLALSQYRMMVDRDYAIITVPVVSIKSTPADNSTDLFIIHEGAKVRILDNSMKEWSEVVYEDGKQGWIENSDYEII